jgi:hypothetical protein
LALSNVVVVLPELLSVSVMLALSYCGGGVGSGGGGGDRVFVKHYMAHLGAVDGEG